MVLRSETVTEYLDFLCANRMNTLYLWNGHPFASLVRLKDFPYAVEVPDDVFQKNQEQFRWLARECDKRGIWLVQMFYNIFVSKPFAETNHISTQLSAPTPLVADYTRKSIAEFVKEFPNVGLMVCLGEALQGTSNQVAWATQTILPGVLDGMRAAGLKKQPPVVIRTHAMDPEAIMPACFQVYSNLFTETKYNGESLTTYEPRGKGQATHEGMAKLGPHLVNIHILSNLEPFRYGATEFIRKSVLASRDWLGASGIHLYPLSYWNWPYAPDIADPRCCNGIAIGFGSRRGRAMRGIPTCRRRKIAPTGLAVSLIFMGATQRPRETFLMPTMPLAKSHQCLFAASESRKAIGRRSRLA